MSYKDMQLCFIVTFDIPCSDLEIDSNWNIIRDNDSQFIDYDHTWNSQSRTYLWFIPRNTPAKIRISRWLQPPFDQAVCFNLWYYTSEPQFSLDIELLQGDDENLIRTVHSISGKDPSIIDWTLIHIQLPSEKVKILIHLNITTSSLALDDLSLDIYDELPLSPPKILFSSDGESSCIENLISLSNYPHRWSIIQANDTIKQENRAPAIDYTLNNELGHYFWLANSDLIDKGNVGYLAINKSFDITNETSYCLSFYYYGYGEQQMSNLKIYPGPRKRRCKRS